MKSSHHLEIKTLIAHLWNDYAAMTPQADQIRALLKERGETFVNDHIALRTFDVAPINLETLATPFLDLGYIPTGEYHFAEKKLYARSYSHPSGNFPRIFISELLTGEFSEKLQTIVRDLVAKLPPTITGKQLLLVQSFWPKISYETYTDLLAESEYAGWLGAFGIRANHFTVSVNNLNTFGNLKSLNGFLECNGYSLNGGLNKIQGSEDLFLEQSSTLASEIPWEFAGGVSHSIRSCYYEFALRYPVPGTWELYDGFVSQSADKIFESTNTDSFQQAS